MILDENGFQNHNNSNGIKNYSNNTFNNNNWSNKFQSEKRNVFTKGINDFNHTDPTNRNDMSDKALAMLHERLEKNLISEEEFNRKCQAIARSRNS